MAVCLPAQRHLNQYQLTDNPKVVTTSGVSQFSDERGEFILTFILPDHYSNKPIYSVSYRCKIVMEHHWLYQTKVGLDYMSLEGASSQSLEALNKPWLVKMQNAIATNMSRSFAAITVASKGNVELLKKLIDEGIDLNIQNKSGDTVLTAAIKSKKFEDSFLIWLMNEHAANPFIINNENKSTLFYACEQNKKKLVHAMLNSSLPCIKNKTVRETVQALRAQAMNAISEGRIGHTPLSLACTFGYSSTVKTMLKMHADTNIPEGGMNLPLYIALRNGDIDLFRELLRYGAETAKSVRFYGNRLSLRALISSAYPHTEFPDLLKNRPKFAQEAYMLDATDTSSADDEQVELTFEDFKRAETQEKCEKMTLKEQKRDQSDEESDGGLNPTFITNEEL
ncbi:MAG: ankyrin repeat domain-containing protein [Parashewanella sp.]